jgi:predicted P-loop ATPase
VFRSEHFNRISFDEFRGSIDIVGIPVWGRSLADEAGYTLLTEYLQRTYGFTEIAENTLYRTISAVAHENTTNVMRDAFQRLGAQYDGGQRLDTWLIDYCQVEDTELHRVFGARWLTGIVARVFQPGCQFDSVLSLEGPEQGEGKTSLLRLLAGHPDFYCSFTGKMNDKDSLMKLRGKLIVEFAEGIATRRAEQDEQKEFITRYDDEYRDPYGRLMRKHKRQFGLAATTNSYHYLNDPSGARRTWPVRVGDIDLDGLKQVLPLIWGEAVVRYLARHRWHIGKDEPLLIGMQKETAEERREKHPWEAIVANWLTHDGSKVDGRWMQLKRREGGPFKFIKSTAVILREVMGIRDQHLDRKNEHTAADVLRALGFEAGKSRAQGMSDNRAVLTGWFHKSLTQEAKRDIAAQWFKDNPLEER